MGDGVRRASSALIDHDLRHLLEYWHAELGFPRDRVVPRSGAPEVLAHVSACGDAARERLDEALTR
jgi:hypothetical protein